MHRSILNRLVLAAALVFALAIPAFSQVTAAISGKIDDPSGGGIRGAEVTATNLETGLLRSAVTGESGDFRLLSLPIGPYRIKAVKSGFKTGVREGISLVVGQDAVVNLRLAIGDLAQEVTVTEAAGVVNTTTPRFPGSWASAK